MMGRKEPNSTAEYERQESNILRILADEYRMIHGVPPGDHNLETLGNLYGAVHALRDGDGPRPRTALCLSGGGIRSASFALGVLQAFAAKGLLDRFHYLSTVSGGGYVGGWLTAWRRNNAAAAKSNLNKRNNALGREPEELRGLRANSNHITPKLGLMSADAWAMAALYLRNVLLNWLIYLPLIVAAFLVPVLIQTTMAAAIYWPALVHDAFLLASALLLMVSLHTSICGRMALARKDRVTQGRFLRHELLPLYVAALLMCLYSVGAYRSHAHRTLLNEVTTGSGAIIAAALYLLAWLWFAARYRRHLPDEWPRLIVSWTVSGAVAGALIGWGMEIASDLASGSSPASGARLVMIFGVGWVAGSLFIAETVYLGLTSYTPRSDADREWLARSSGWFLALSFSWGLLAALVAYAPEVARNARPEWLWALLPVGGGAGAISAALGSSAKTLAGLFNKDSKSGSLLKAAILSGASLVFLVALIVVIGEGIDWWISLMGQYPRDFADLGTVVAIAPGLLLCITIVVVLSVPINVNRFSPHSLYRNRMARAFVSAARGQAGLESDTRDLLTGFDFQDNPRMSDLATASPGSNGRPRLFHVVNMTLNVVPSNNNVWRERTTQSFVVTPQLSGNEHVGFCDTKEYGAGISLGTAMAISGVAASPNHGYHSSPLIGLIMTLFGVRLGWWLGNPRHPEKAVRAGPKWGVLQVIKELFGLNDDDDSYVFLSDGGHFDNLGLYEMVRRRCHMIVVSDGSCDENCSFADLGTAMRKIWIDFGIRIDFKKVEIRKRGADKALYCALGRIYYPELQGTSYEPGYLLYIKPGFHDDGTEPLDVCGYALANPAFPHEATADQLFSESQFESYRSLGQFVANTILGVPGEPDMSAPTLELRPFWKHLCAYVAQYDNELPTG
jgi:Patatin-like phospholipase